MSSQPDNSAEDDTASVETEYLAAGEAARVLMVSSKTVARWADLGYIPHWFTLGGHRRFARHDIANLAISMNETRQLASAPKTTT